MNAPPGHWLLGHLPALRSDPLGLLSSCRPPVAKLSLGRSAWLLLEPADIEHVLRDEGGVYTKGRAFAYGLRLYGNSLLVSEGEEHRRQTRRIGKLFFQHAARSFLEQAAETTDRFACRWQAGQTIDLWPSLVELTLTLSSQAIVGDDWLPGWMRGSAGPGEGEAVQAAFEAAMAHVARQNFALLPLPDWLPLPPVLRYRKAVATLDAAIAGAVERRRRGEARGGLLDALLTASEEEDGSLSPAQVRDQALIFVLGGYESSATALFWTLLLLSRHPEVRRRVIDEAERVVGGRLARPEDASRLTYTGQVFCESLRLYPPPWLLPRTLSREDSLPSGVRLPAGSLVFLSPYRTQRDERFFPDPLTFDPERFAPGAQATWPAGAYFPFGGGVRRCLGEGVARAQAVLILATLCRRWDFQVEGEGLPAPRPLLVLRPPVPLRVRVVPASP